MVMVEDLMPKFFFGTAGGTSRDSFESTILADPLLLFTITIFFVINFVGEAAASVGF